MTTIYKYEIGAVSGEQVIPAFKHWVPVDVQVQHHSVCLWAVVDTESEKVDQKIIVVLTGERIQTPFKANYVATAQVGDFAIHVFHKIGN